MSRALIFVGVLATLLASVGRASAQDDAHADELGRRQLLGRLAMTRVSVTLDRVPVRDALQQLGYAVGVTIIGRYGDDPTGHGIDPTAEITLRLDDVTGLDALEMILDQATLYASCTWQLRRGFVEVGTKRRLTAATDRRAYQLDDLLIEAPYFGTTPVNLIEFDRHPYRSASLKTGDAGTRSGRGRLTEELVRAIVEVVEPANWDFELAQAPPTGRPPGSPRVARPGPYRSTQRAVARLRRWQDNSLVVVAPDFFHRQIAGYGKPITPVPPSTAAPSVAGGGIVFAGIDGSASGPATLFRGRRPAPRDRAPGTIDGRRMGDEFVRYALAALRTRITVAFDDVPVKDAIARLGRMVDLPIIGRFDDDRLGYGIPASARITLHLKDAPALDVLEALLEACSPRDTPCSWQMRRGYVEVGTKTRLSVPAARTLKLYPVADLTIDIPDSFADLRQLPATIGLDLVETVITSVEPDAWDFGQIEHYGDDAELGREVTVRGDRGNAGDPGQPQPAAARTPAVYFQVAKPAIIRYWRGVLIVVAPDFIHRQLEG